MAARIRSNFQNGTITDNPLAIAATSVNSAEFASLPVVTAPDLLAVTLDAEGTTPEIVHITAHTASATVATIVRGQEGTAAKAHAQNASWVHASTARDAGSGAIYRYKTADQVKTSEITPAVDNHMVWTDLPVGPYLVDGVLLVGTDNTFPDMRTNFGGNIENWTVGVVGVGTGTSTDSLMGTMGDTAAAGVNADRGLISASDHCIILKGYLEVTVGGLVEFRWSQRQVGAQIIRLFKGSWISLIPV